MGTRCPKNIATGRHRAALRRSLLNDTLCNDAQNARIDVLFVSHPSYASVLQRQLGEGFDVMFHPRLPDESVLERASICIIDGPRCLAHQDLLRTRKARKGPMALPVLLLTTQDNTFWREQTFADVIDETVLMPTDPRLLQLRVQALLKTQRLHQDNEHLLSSQAAHVEALLREREIRSRFVAAISHDLRIPLTSTQMAADMLLRGPPLSDKQRKFVDRVVASVERMDAMIYNILDANQLQQNQSSPLHLTSGNISDMVGKAVEDWRVQYPTRFASTIYPQAQGHWDTHAIRRALDNLVNNALKYGAPNAPIRIELTYAPEIKTATIDVCNQGATIPAAQQNQLFEIFHRTPSAAAGNQQGWGIGLSVVRGIARAHGGEVSVESTAAAGTRFRIRVVSQAPISA